MRVILSSFASLYGYTASALSEAGYLQRYITTLVPLRRYRWLMRTLPKNLRLKLAGRSLDGVDERLVVSLTLPEFVQRMGRFISVERANWALCYIYDWLAMRWVEPCDVFHFVSCFGLYSARKAKRMGAVIVCDERTEYPDFQRRVVSEEYQRLGLKSEPPGLLYDDKIKQEYAVADYLIVTSEYAKQTFLEAGFDEDRVFVVPCGFDTKHFFPEKVINHIDDIFRIIFCGQGIPRKGLHYLLQAFEQLCLPKSELLIVGPIDVTLEPMLREKTARNQSIKLVGPIPKIALREVYNRASVLVLPSLADSFGLVCLEAMACGLPVIVSENTGSKQVIRDGTDGFVIPIRDIEALKDRLLRLYNDRALLARMAHSAGQRALGFTWSNYKSTLLEVYREIAQREGLSNDRSKKEDYKGR